jgi:hypothetical protein
MPGVSTASKREGTTDGRTGGRSDLGFAFYAEDAESCRGLFRAGEEAGCEVLGFGDSQSPWMDTYVGDELRPLLA